MQCPNNDSATLTFRTLVYESVLYNLAVVLYKYWTFHMHTVTLSSTFTMSESLFTHCIPHYLQLHVKEPCKKKNHNHPLLRICATPVLVFIQCFGEK